MHALLLRTPTGAPPVPLVNARLAATVDYDEAWLQRLLFDHPNLLPLDVIDPGAGRFIPLCRELAMPKPGGSVFLDLFRHARSSRKRQGVARICEEPYDRRQ